MKIVKFLLLYILIFIYGVSCQSPNYPNNLNEDLLSNSQKTVNITCDSCVLYIRPTIEQIDQIKSNYENEESFYVMADDANYYSANAIEYLQDKNINIFYLDSIKTVCFNGKDTFNYDDLAWDFVLYKKNKTPQIVNAIDLKIKYNDYFGIKESKSEEQNEWDIATEIVSITNDDIGDLNMTSWSNDCHSDYSAYFSTVGVQFHFSTNYTINTILERRNATTYAVYFSHPIIRPIPENMQDCQNYAENVPIAKIEQTNNELKFTWLGFYDTKKRTRVHTENPFNSKQQSIILEKCD